MSLEHAMNLGSLRVVREELDNTLQRASGEFEVCLVDPTSLTALRQCHQDLVQVRGALRLIELSGAALLTEEMIRCLEALTEQGTAGEEGSVAPAMQTALLAALSNAFVVLPRYLDFVARQQSELPILVLPWLNQLRAVRREAFVPEYHFENWQPPALVQPLDWPQRPPSAEAVKRLRNMFQAGLVAAIKASQRSGAQRNDAGAELMARAAQRLSERFPPEAGGGVLPLLAGVTASLAEGGLVLNLNRKRTLAGAEQLLGRLQRQGIAALSEEAVAPLRHALLFMLALAPDSGRSPSSPAQSMCVQLRQAFGLVPQTPDDVALNAHREAMQGSGDAIDSVIAVLREELGVLKGTLEIGAQNQGLLDDDLTRLRSDLERFADTLQVLNLQVPADGVRQHLAAVDRWRGRSGQVSLEEFQVLADAMLFAESCLSALARHALDPRELQALAAPQRDRIIAESHLAEAQALVLREAQSGIQLAKRAITAYVEAGLDRTHIANVASTLRTVCGGLAILRYERAAAVVASCAAFVAHHQSERHDASSQIQKLLETLADALISMDYYLGELEASGQSSDHVLSLAEDSLAVLDRAMVPA